MKRMMWAMGLTLVLLSTNLFADPVVRDGKEWLQPADFTNLSWNDAVAVCPEPNFLCDGELNGIDVTGFTFASIEQITDLFNSYGIDPPLGPAPDSVSKVDSTWAPAFFDEFSPTLAVTLFNVVRCLSSTALYPEVAAYGTMWDSLNSGDPTDSATSSLYPPDARNPEVAICLCRDVQSSAPKAVPTMPTYMLLITILGLIAIASGGLFRRKFKDG